MADALYTRSAVTTLRMLAKYGRSLTLRRVTTGAYAAGAATQTTKDEAVTGFDMTSSLGQIPARLIEGATGLYMLAASGMTAYPAIDDQLIVGANTFKIVKVTTVDPGGLAVYHELQVQA